MKIKQKVFNELSKTSQEDVVSIGYKCLKWIEQFGEGTACQATVSDYGRGIYNLQEVYAHANLLNSCFDENVIEMSNSIEHGTGMERRLTVDLIIKYKPKTQNTLKEFLKKVVSAPVAVNVSDSEKILELDVENQIIRCGDKECKFRQNGSKKNKRFEMVETIFKSRTPATKLGDNIQHISNEITDINTRVKRKLGVDKFIVNDNNSGYEVNKAYKTKKG